MGSAAPARTSSCVDEEAAAAAATVVGVSAGSWALELRSGRELLLLLDIPSTRKPSSSCSTQTNKTRMNESFVDIVLKKAYNCCYSLKSLASSPSSSSYSSSYFLQLRLSSPQALYIKVLLCTSSGTASSSTQLMLLLLLPTKTAAFPLPWSHDHQRILSKPNLRAQRILLTYILTNTKVA